MKARRRTTILASVCLSFCFAASVLVLRTIDRIRPQATLEDVLYISSPKLLKRASLGYDGLLADIYWTRAVQYFGSQHSIDSANFDLLGPLLEIATNLDPHLIVAYEFGGSFLAPPPPNGAGQPDRAIQLLEYGIRNNPNEWRLYYNLGFVYYMDLQDYAHASDAFERGSHAQNAHPFLKVLAAQMAQHAGEYQTARMLWSATYQTSQDKLIKGNAVEHLRALRVEEDVTYLEEGVTHFGERTGRLPASMAELLGAMGMSRVPVDPDGHPYKLTPEGRVEVLPITNSEKTKTAESRGEENDENSNARAQIIRNCSTMKYRATKINASGRMNLCET
jgi:tetratricopeptide (TPR) repeat protein